MSLSEQDLWICAYRLMTMYSEASFPRFRSISDKKSEVSPLSTDPRVQNVHAQLPETVQSALDPLTINIDHVHPPIIPSLSVSEP